MVIKLKYLIYEWYGSCILIFVPKVGKNKIFLSFSTLKSLKGRFLFFLFDISQTDHEIMQDIFCLIRINDRKAIQLTHYRLLSDSVCVVYVLCVSVWGTYVAVRGCCWTSSPIILHLSFWDRVFPIPGLAALSRMAGQ